ncbi:hypothetical protein CKY10_03205 [Photorhabdus sp. HUG-39]|nr:hypothetical protein CKY10_03205 [Photorhabdus sp. HUG-39]
MNIFIQYFNKLRSISPKFDIMPNTNILYLSSPLKFFYCHVSLIKKTVGADWLKIKEPQLSG